MKRWRSWRQQDSEKVWKRNNKRGRKIEVGKDRKVRMTKRERVRYDVMEKLKKGKTWNKSHKQRDTNCNTKKLKTDIEMKTERW